jgi:hypothetical protein
LKENLCLFMADCFSQQSTTILASYQQGGSQASMDARPPGASTSQEKRPVERLIDTGDSVSDVGAGSTLPAAAIECVGYPRPEGSG